MNAAARTTAFSLLPADVDVCVPLDLGERRLPGWRAELEKAWVPNTTRLCYWCAWYMGLKEKAAEHLRAALVVNPGDARLRNNAQFILPDMPASPQFSLSQG